MLMMTAIQSASDWRERLPSKLLVAAQLLETANQRRNGQDPQLGDAIDAAKDGLCELALEGTRSREGESIAEWLDWIRRVLCLLEGMISMCVGSRCARNHLVGNELELVALELEELGAEAAELSKTLLHSALRGAA
jgi:hypothetical protein